MPLNAIKRALQLRKTLEKDGKILVADLEKTLQGVDTSRVIPLMPNKDGKLVFRAKFNVKELDPLASDEYETDKFNVSNMTKIEIEDFIKKSEFDFPLWWKYHRGFDIKNILDYNPPFIFQVAGCNFHDGSEIGGCYYCFNDNESNDGIPGEGKVYLGIEDTINSFLSARKKIKSIYKKNGVDLNIQVLRSSGGEPTPVLDWILNLWREIGRRNLSVVGQIDTNLSTGPIVDKFEEKGIYEENILEKLAKYPIKILAAIKGIGDQNLESNVQCTTTIRDQIYSIRKLLNAGFDIYPQMYNPNPKDLKPYLMYMDNLIENFSLKIHIGPLKADYGPTIKRLTAIANKRKVNPKRFINQKKKECNAN